MKTPRGTMRMLRRAALKGVDLKSSYPNLPQPMLKAAMDRKVYVLKKGFVDNEFFPANFELDAYYAKHGGRPAADRGDQP